MTERKGSTLASTVSGKLIEPDIDTLKQLTTREQVWAGLSAWPAEHVWSRIAAVVASHRFAIVKHDHYWLTQLYLSWEECPEEIGDLWRLRAEGEIGLGLAPAGPRPCGWSDEELARLEEEGFLRPDAPSDRAWSALAMRHFADARDALAEYDEILVALPPQWEAAPHEGLRQILGSPDAVLHVQRDALVALLERAQR